MDMFKQQTRFNYVFVVCSTQRQIEYSHASCVSYARLLVFVTSSDRLMEIVH